MRGRRIGADSLAVLVVEMTNVGIRFRERDVVLEMRWGERGALTKRGQKNLGIWVLQWRGEGK